MISEVIMPQMGADMEEGTVVRWLKREGDAVERGEDLRIFEVLFQLLQAGVGHVEIRLGCG